MLYFDEVSNNLHGEILTHAISEPPFSVVSLHCKKRARPVLTAGSFLCKHVVRCEYGTLISTLKQLNGESNYALAA